MSYEPIPDESGMTFGPFPPDNCFHIEASDVYEALGEGVKMAEFLWLRTKGDQTATVWVVEAKTSFVRPEPKAEFDQEIDKIREKLTNALSLGLAACLKRHPAAKVELPQVFRDMDLSSADFRLVLVVKNHQRAWLPPLKDKLAKALRPVVKTWALLPSAVVVMNETGARKQGLIAGNAGSVPTATD